MSYINRVSYNYNIIPFLVGFFPILTLPKIFLGFDFLPVFFDLLVCVLMVRFILMNRIYNDIASVLFFLLIFIVNVLYFFNSDIPGIYNRVSSFRLSSFYIIAFFLPFIMFIDEIFFEKVIFWLKIVSFFICFNALRQWIFPFSQEIEFANLAGGAAKFLGDEFQGGENDFRVFSTFITSVHLVGFLGLILYLMVSSLLCGVASDRSTEFLIFLCIFVILLTFSRSGWLSIVAGFIPLGFVFFRRQVVVKLFFIFVLVFCVVYVFYMFSDLFSARLNTLFDLEGVSSFQTRLLVWEDRVSVVENNIWGHGAGAAGWNVHPYMGLGADSNYIKFYLEFGLLFGTLMILFLFFISYRGFCGLILYKKKFKETRDIGLDGVFLVSGMCFIVSMLVQMVTNQISEAYPTNFYFWFFSGLVCRISLTFQRLSNVKIY